MFILLFSYFGHLLITNNGILSLKSVKIVLTFFLLWITTQFDTQIEDYMAYFLILSLGILHGSNDIRLFNSMQKKNVKGYRRILITYIVVVLIAFSVFMLIPRLGLLVFVLISGYHFGEQHLADKVDSGHYLRSVLFTLYGLFIFSMIFYTHFEDVYVIVQDISNMTIVREFYLYFMLGMFLSMAILIVIMIRMKFLHISLPLETAYLLLFYVLFMNSTLLWSFAIYFIVWHSIPSLRDQILNLYKTVSFRTVMKYVKDSILYWVVSIVGITVLIVLTKDDVRLFNLLFFAFLAAITLPHVIVLGKMHE